jgi:hydrogenase maturation factor HypF (carbamoyltransferase family)
MRYNRVGLSGGVFQNRILCEQVFSLLHADNFQAFLGEKDAIFLRFGQVVEILFTNELWGIIYDNG